MIPSSMFGGFNFAINASVLKVLKAKPIRKVYNRENCKSVCFPTFVFTALFFCFQSKPSSLSAKDIFSGGMTSATPWMAAWQEISSPTEKRILRPGGRGF